MVLSRDLEGLFLEADTLHSFRVPVGYLTRVL